MAQIEVLLPKMGESVAEATITKWLKAEGDTIESEESLVEIATDKVDSEVPAPEDGVIAKILVQEGEVVEVGKPIAIISTDGETVDSTPAPAAVSAPAAAAEKVPFQPQAAPVAETTIANTSDNGRFYSPLVRNIAGKEGIGMAELDGVQGTGHNGRVTKKDILTYVENRGQNGSETTINTPVAPAQETPATPAAAKKK